MSKVKIFLVLGIILGIIGLVIYNNYSNTPTTVPVQSTNLNQTNVKVPQCVDGIDNDLDGFVDYTEDNDCTDASDNSERNWDWLKFLALGIVIAGAGLTTYWYFWLREKKEDDNGLFEKPINGDRAYDIILDKFLREHVDDIHCIPNEKDSTLMKPKDKKAIQRINHFPIIKHSEHFLYNFIRITQGNMAGEHVLSFSLSRGEEHLKGGTYRLELNKPYEIWENKFRTFPMSSPETKSEKIALALAETADSAEEYNAILAQSLKNVNSSQGNDLTDEEYSNWIQSQRTQPKNKKKKNNNQQSPIQYVEAHAEEADEQ